MALNPHMKAFITHGQYDLVTPYYASDRLRNLMRLDPQMADRLTVQHYGGGHMFYAWETSRHAFTAAIAAFVADATSVARRRTPRQGLGARRSQLSRLGPEYGLADALEPNEKDRVTVVVGGLEEHVGLGRDRRAGFSSRIDRAEASAPSACRSGLIRRKFPADLKSWLSVGRRLFGVR